MVLGDSCAAGRNRGAVTNAKNAMHAKNAKNRGACGAPTLIVTFGIFGTPAIFGTLAIFGTPGIFGTLGIFGILRESPVGRNRRRRQRQRLRPGYNMMFYPPERRSE
jgi:hypothetical protein